MPHPFKAKKSLGQNFLTNPKIAEKIAKTADILPGETVLEIGPGTGMLTRALLTEGARVVAIEADIRAVETLKEAFASEIADGRFTLLHADIRTTPVESLQLPKEYKVVANIPYYLSGMLFETFTSATIQPKTIVFLVQKEVAERIVRDKKESILSLSIKVYGTPSYCGTVSRGNFSPQPGVDSAILKITDISRKKLAILDDTDFFRVLKTGFSSRRKHLVGNLSAIAPRTEIAELFKNLGIRPDARGEDLAIDTWIAIASALSERSV